MQSNTIKTTSNFSSRELRRFRSIFRARNQFFTKFINPNTSKNVADYIQVNLYAASGNMSPQERINFRQQFTKLTTNNLNKVHIQQFTISKSQKYVAFSNLNKVRSLFKGNCFERTFFFKNDSNYNIQKEIFSVINSFTKKESNSFKFSPNLIIFPTKMGVVTLTRYIVSAKVFSNSVNPYLNFISNIQTIYLKHIRFLTRIQYKPYLYTRLYVLNSINYLFKY